jgi:hypothetical protein
MSITDPAHYKDLYPEPIEVIGGSTYTLGNTWKYIARAGHKPGATREDDVSKARWYVTRIISDRMNAGSDIRQARRYAAQGLLRLWGRFLEAGPEPEERVGEIGSLVATTVADILRGALDQVRGI